MSFRCGFCNQDQPRGTKPVRVVTEIRQGEGKVRDVSDTSAEYVPGPWQIAKEILACPDCARIPRKPEVVEVKK